MSDSPHRTTAELALAPEVLVTGASGFIGRTLVAALLATGRQVTALARHPPAVPDGQAVRWVAGDLCVPESYLAHVKPGIAVFHLAAMRSHAGRHRADFEALNVTACGELARACHERGVHRFVQVTTAHLLGPSRGETARREDDGPAVCRAAEEPAVGEYERTRGLGLLAVRRLVDEGLDAVSLCPTIIFGPDHPSHPNRITDELRRIVAGRRALTVLIGGGTARRDLVHVDDVVDAALAAERWAPAGAELLLGGEAVSHRDLIARTLALLGRPRAGRQLDLPGPAALAAARLADRVLRYEAGCGTVAAVQRALSEWRFDSSRARQLLGYRPRPLDEGLAATLRWLAAAGAPAPNAEHR